MQGKDSPGVCAYDPRDSLNVGNATKFGIGTSTRFFEMSNVTQLKQTLPHSYLSSRFVINKGVGPASHLAAADRDDAPP